MDVHNEEWLSRDIWLSCMKNSEADDDEQLTELVPSLDDDLNKKVVKTSRLDGGRGGGVRPIVDGSKPKGENSSLLSVPLIRCIASQEQDDDKDEEEEDTKQNADGVDTDTDGEVHTTVNPSVVKEKKKRLAPLESEGEGQKELVSFGPTLEDEIKVAIARSTADEQFRLAVEKALSLQVEKALSDSMQEQEVSSGIMSEQDVHDSNAAMMSSTLGRAWMLSRRMMEVHERYKGLGEESPDGAYYQKHVDILPVDDMVVLAKNFLDCQDYFARNYVSSSVTIGYHFTTKESLEYIKQRGLLTQREQKLLNISLEQKFRSNAFGSGIYLGSNPFAFGKYGDGVGILVAMLRGKTCRVVDKMEALAEAKRHNTVVGNKSRSKGIDDCDSERNLAVGHFSDEFVLQESSQSLPLFHFRREMAERSDKKSQEGNDVLWKLHETVQSTLDELTNRGVKTALTRILPTHRRQLIGGLGGVAPPSNDWHTVTDAIQVEAESLHTHQQVLPPAPYSGFQCSDTTLLRFLTPMDDPLHETYELNYTAPTDSGKGLVQETIPKDACDTAETAPKQNSSVCRQPHSPSSLAGFSCFGKDVDRQYVRFITAQTGEEGTTTTSETATCSILPSQQDMLPGETARTLCHGKSPSGKMIVTRTRLLRCGGYEDSTERTIVIEYRIFRGTQKSYHPQPGSSFPPTKRLAYLPDNEEGRRALYRLIYAWMHGLTSS